MKKYVIFIMKGVNMKKRLILLMLFGVVLFGATGCGKTTEEFLEDEIIDVETEMTLGEWNENTYTNEFLGLTYQKPEDWTRYSDEEIKSLMEIGLENVDGSELSKKLAELTSVTYVMASKASGTNIIIMSEKPVLSTNLDNFSKTLKSQLESQTAMEYTVKDAVVEQINGKELYVLEASVSGMTQKYYLYEQGEHIVSIILTLVGTDNATDIINQITFE